MHGNSDVGGFPAPVVASASCACGPVRVIRTQVVGRFRNLQQALMCLGAPTNRDASSRYSRRRFGDPVGARFDTPEAKPTRGTVERPRGTGGNLRELPRAWRRPRCRQPERKVK